MDLTKQTETPQAYAPDLTKQREPGQKEAPQSHTPGLTLHTKPSSAQVHAGITALQREIPHVYPLNPTMQEEGPQAYAHHSANSHLPAPMRNTTNPQITLPLPPGPDHAIPLPVTVHNSLMQQSGYVPAASGKPPQRQLSVNMPRPQRATPEKLKLKVLSHFSVSVKPHYCIDFGQQLDFFLCTDDNPTVMNYYQFKGRCISEVSKRPIPAGHKYNNFKFIMEQYIIFQSQQNQVSVYSHDLQLIKTHRCPGWIVEVIGELYAIVKSITTKLCNGVPVVTINKTSLTNFQEIHHELESPHPKAYDVDAVLFVCGWLDGRIAITQKEGRYADFYSITGRHIQRVDLDGVTGWPSCTTQHVLVPISKKPGTILVFTWAGKLIQHLEPGLGLNDTCGIISSVHEGKLNLWVDNEPEQTHKVITCEMQECEEDDEDDEDDEDLLERRQ